MTAAQLPAGMEPFIREQMQQWAVPGLTIALLQTGRVTTAAFGVASVETEAPVRPDYLFRAGSISKVFTATLAMQLVDEGLLDLDQPVVKYLPALRMADPEARERITMRHLLSHTAGFYGDRFADYGWGDDALDRAIAEFDTLRQWTPPGETWFYSNNAFQLAGAVVQTLRRQPFEDVARERLLRPLGLERTFYHPWEIITYPLAAGHNLDASGTPRVTRVWSTPRCRNTNGGVTTTVADLLRFAQLHLGDGASANGTRILSREAVREMQRPQAVAACFADQYGLAWALRDAGDTRTAGHGGTTNGYRARLQLLTEQGLALALLNNGSEGHHANDQIEAWWLERVAGLQRPRAVTTTLPSAALARVLGRYQRPDNEITVTAHDGGIRIAVAHIDAFTKERVRQISHALPVNDRVFLGLDGEAMGETVDFLGGDNEAPRFLRLNGRLAERPAPA